MSSPDKSSPSKGIITHNDLLEKTVSEKQTGFSNDYYMIYVARPTTKKRAYYVECNDVIEALGLNFAEANILKALWRIAAFRRGMQRKAAPLYDAEKISFFAKRVLIKEQENAETSND